MKNDVYVPVDTPYLSNNTGVDNVAKWRENKRQASKKKPQKDMHYLGRTKPLLWK